MTTHALPWHVAWERALYGADGFFRSTRPAEHFRTNAHVGAFAEAIAELVRRTDSSTVVDLGAGGGELLGALRDLLGGDVRLIGVEVADRPADLPTDITWLDELPQQIDGMLLANEWLDNVPCDVVEVDENGAVRKLLVDPATGMETLGETYQSVWLDSWWALTESGERAEIGAARDAAWVDAVSRVDGLAVAIDYGHLGGDRPPFGSLRSYARGHEVAVVPDGSRDVTAHVAVDAVAAACGARLVRQREALGILGIDAARPPLELARSDPSSYVRALTRAGEEGELVATGGLGDFWWMVTDTLGRGTLGP